MQNVFISRKEDAAPAQEQVIAKPNKRKQLGRGGRTRKNIKKVVGWHYTLKKSKVILKNMPEGGRINDLTAVFIKKALNKRISRNKIAEYLNINISTVQGIVYGRSYKELEPALSQEAIQEARSRNYKAATEKKRTENKLVTHSVIDEETALHIKRELAKGVFARKIAEQLGINDSIVFNISCGESWKNVQLEPGEAERLWEENAEEREIAAAELAEARTKNRPVGSQHGGAILDEDDVLEIKLELLEGKSFAEIGEKYGVGRATINGIANYKCWTHVRLSGAQEKMLRDMDFTVRYSNPGESSANAKLTDAKVLEIKREMLAGTTMSELARRYEIGKTTVGHIKNGRSWSHIRLSDEEEERLAVMDFRENRKQFGSDSSNAVFTEAQVLEIKHKLLGGMKVTGPDGLAAEYGVSSGAINAIKHGKSWTHVRMADDDEALLAGMCRSMMGTETVLSIKQGLRDGKSTRELATRYGVSKATVCNIGKGKVYADIKLPRQPYVNVREMYESLRMIYDNPVDKSGIKLITHSYNSKYNNSDRPNYFGGEGVFGVVYYKEFYVTERDDAGNETETLAGRYVGSRYAGPLTGYDTSSKLVLKLLKSHSLADLRIETTVLRQCYGKKELLRWETYYQQSHNAVDDPGFFNQTYALDLCRKGRTKESIRDLSRNHYTFKKSRVVIRGGDRLNTITAAFIKRALNKGIHSSKIAAYLGIKESLLKSILFGAAWLDVKPELSDEVRARNAEMSMAIAMQARKEKRDAGLINSNAKLQESDVVFIKKCLLMGLTGSKIAAHLRNRKLGRQLDITDGVIYSISSGKQWSHIQLPPDVEALYAARYKERTRYFSEETRQKMSDALTGRNHGEDNYNSVLKENDVIYIKRQLLAGKTYSELAAEFDVTNGTIAHIKNGRAWTHVRLSDTEEEQLANLDLKKLRRPKGSAVPNSKLTEEQVLEIRRMMLAGDTLQAIADKFGVKNNTVLSIRDGSAWTHVRLSDEEEAQFAATDFKEMHKLQGEDVYNAKITDEIALAIKRALLSGAGIHELADRYGVGDTVIQGVRTGRTWKHVRLSDAEEQQLQELDLHGWKLKKEDVLEIKQAILDRSASIEELAARYGVGRGTIGGITSGRSWAHVRLTDEQEEELRALDLRTENRRTGADNPAAKLNDELVLAIRHELRVGNKITGAGGIADRFGINQATVHLIKNGTAWPHVRMSDEEEAELAALDSNVKLDEAKVLQIKREIRNGATSKAVAEKFGVHLATIARIRQGKRWAHVHLPEDETPSTINTTG